VNVITYQGVKNILALDFCWKKAKILTTKTLKQSQIFTGEMLLIFTFFLARLTSDLIEEVANEINSI
jgi:hypothetical protein